MADILFLSTRFLLPMDAGGKIRSGNILKHLSKNHNISVFSRVEHPQDTPFISQMTEMCSSFHPVPHREVKKHTAAYYRDVIISTLSKYPVSVLRDYSRSMEAALYSELDRVKYDLVICDFVQSALHLKKPVPAKSLLFQHNVESDILFRHYRTCRDPISRAFWYSQFRKMFVFEKRKCRSFDAVIAVSEQDKQSMREKFGIDNVFDIPTGVDTDFFCPRATTPEKGHIVFVGSLDWDANDDAVRYFAKAILPIIRERIPDVQLTLVGKNPSPRLRSVVDKSPNISLTERVEDVRPYIARSSAVIVPLRIGGGTRMKIYEAMAMARPVVTTSIGAEGLPIRNNVHALFADDPRSFARKTVEILENPDMQIRLGDTARDYVEKHFGWPMVAQAFGAICENVVKGT